MPGGRKSSIDRSTERSRLCRPCQEKRSSPYRGSCAAHGRTSQAGGESQDECRSDFRKIRLKRQALNFGALNPYVTIRRLMQLYECHASFILRQAIPPTDTLRKRASAIDMLLTDERGLHVPCDIRHWRLLARLTCQLYSSILKRGRWPLKQCRLALCFWLHAELIWLGWAFWGAPVNVRDAHDGNWKLQSYLVLRAGRRARAWNFAIVHARHDVRTAGNGRWRNRGDYLFDLPEKAEAYSPALPANSILVRHLSRNWFTPIVPFRYWGRSTHPANSTVGHPLPNSAGRISTVNKFVNGRTGTRHARRVETRQIGQRLCGDTGKLRRFGANNIPTSCRTAHHACASFPVCWFGTYHSKP